MIQSFRDRESERIFRREPSRAFQSIARIALRRLLQVDAAATLESLRYPPGNWLEALRGDRKGQHSLRINDQFRVCFLWREGQAYDVEVTEYH